MNPIHQKDPPFPLWTTDLTQPATVPPILIGKTLFVATQAAGRGAQPSDLFALDGQTGQVVWQHHFEHALISGLQPYTLQDQQQPIVVVTTRSSDILRGKGQLLAFNPAGDIVWQWQNEEKSYSAPVVQGMQVLVIVGDRSLAIINPQEEGDSVTRIPLPVTTSLAAPAVQDNITFIPCRSPELVAVGLDGSVLWHFQLPNSPHAWLDHTPVLVEDRLFTVSRAGIVYCINPMTGSLIWQESVGAGRGLSRPMVADGNVFVGTRHGLTILNSQNGQIGWTFGTPRPISAPALVIQEIAYVGAQDHKLYALNAKTGAERWQHTMPDRIETAPVLIDGKLIIADRKGNVIALPLPDVAEDVKSSTNDPIRLQASKRKRAAAWESANKPLQAAPLWLEIGELEKAAEALAAGGSWIAAANIWQQLERYGKRAEALEQHAIQLTSQEIDAEEKGAAWAQAARAHAEIGQKEARLRCEREAARFWRQPILNIELKPGTLIFNAWSKLDYTIRNDGFGAAHQVLVQLADDRFEGQGSHSLTLVTIQPNRAYQHWLDVLPKAQGSAVPMQLLIEYKDRLGNLHSLKRRLHLPVTRETPDGQQTGSQRLGEEHSGIPSDLYTQLITVLLDCGSFATNRELKVIFVDERLSPWQYRLPQAGNPTQLVKSVIDFLHNQQNAEGENALVLLLQVLSGHLEPEDACHQRLADLANELEREIKSRNSTRFEAN